MASQPRGSIASSGHFTPSRAPQAVVDLPTMGLTLHACGGVLGAAASESE